MLISYAAVAAANSSPVLVGAETMGTRSALFTSLAATSGALLGFAITSVSVLLALPSRESVKRLRGLRAWQLLNEGLLSAAGLFAITLIYSTLALAVDTAAQPNEWLEIPLIAFAVAAIAELLVVGAAFAWVVTESGSRRLKPKR